MGGIVRMGEEAEEVLDRHGSKELRDRSLLDGRE